MRSSVRMLRLSVAVALAAAVLTAPASAAPRVRVVHPGESIQDAVDAASPGDTIAVRAGTYRENLLVQKNGISLRAGRGVVLRPPAPGRALCNRVEQVGICVIPADLDLATNAYTRRVRDVSITGFRIAGFEGDGIFGFGTRNLHVAGVRAAGNTDYGMASFDGVGTRFVGNAVNGSDDAGLYVGDSPDANAAVLGNRSWDNALGVLVRHDHNVVVAGNTTWNNCAGVFLLDDGQDGGSGHTAVLDNVVRRNNHRCTQFAGFLLTPAVAGGGIVAVGSQHNVVAHNVVRGNSGRTGYSGGIVLVATTRVSTNGAFSPSTGNVVLGNRVSRNRPADIVEDRASSDNLVVHNHCRTSSPRGLCGG